MYYRLKIKNNVLYLELVHAHHLTNPYTDLTNTLREPNIKGGQGHTILGNFSIDQVVIELTETKIREPLLRGTRVTS